MTTTCFFALGGNIGDTYSIFCRCLELLSHTPGVNEIISSKIYQTSPVSSLLQPDYLNAVCKVTTSLNHFDFFSLLQQLETKLGKVPKAKNAPRVIDLDLLFFGSIHSSDPYLTLPHPKWEERLFVILPLKDVMKDEKLDKIGAQLQKKRKEKIKLLPHRLPFSLGE